MPTASLRWLRPTHNLRPDEHRSPRVHTITGVTTSATAFIGAARRGPLNRAAVIRSFAEFESRFGPRASHLELGHGILQFFLNGGAECWVVRIAQKTTAAKLAKALALLDAIDIVNLLVMPGVTQPELIELAVAFCARRRAFLIADAPAAATASAILAQLEAGAWPASPDAALYFPWINVSAEPGSGALRKCAPSGSIAGLFARTDRERGVWKTAAGIDGQFLGVASLAATVSEVEQAALNGRGVNCLRALPPAAAVVWGVRTLAGRDGAPFESKYIGVRRLLLFIEESISRGTTWVGTEENAEPLWAELRTDIGAFLEGLFRAGAFAGRTSREAYFVKCDGQTTTAEDIASGTLNITVGVAPLKPAEFALIHIRQSAAR